MTGTHGDELEGQFVCYELNRRIMENISCLRGIVDIYPALNPLGIDSISRGVPMFDLDMNRIFPGTPEGPMMETVVGQLMDDIAGADMCIDIHASNIFLEEMPQVRINEETAQNLVPFAEYLNVDFVWVHASATVLESTLAYSLVSDCLQRISVKSYIRRVLVYEKGCHIRTPISLQRGFECVGI